MGNLEDLQYYQNYHKHTSLSHRYNKDSPLVPEDYFKFMIENFKEYPKIYSTVEHGWQENYFNVYNKIEEINENFNNKIVHDKPNKFYSPDCKPFKFIFGTEAYWVKDRFGTDSSNCHIVLLAKNDNGRKKLNRAIYESFKTGYYYKNRMDLDILLSLPKDDIFVTSACLAFWKSYAIDPDDRLPFDDDGNKNEEIDYSEIDEIVLKLHNHFTDFYLEVQANNTDIQKRINRHILELHYKYGIPIIAGTDSHVIYDNQLEDREDLLRSNKISYPEEIGWYMDYPTLKIFIERFRIQGILNNDEIYEAINNTNVILTFEDIILDRSLKVPVMKKYQHLSQEERNQIFEDILKKEWELQKDDINVKKLDEYIKEIKHDIKEIEDCNMADYFIDNYEIMRRGIELYGGILTPSGRGSAVSMYLNKLLRFTKVDKVNAPVLMYSERFLTADRIIKSKTPPDCDHNVSSREPFIQAQRDLIGEEGTFDLLALGTLHYKSAFKMYARAYKLDPTLANEVSKQIDKYEKALKYAEEDEKDLIDIYDYVDKEKYEHLIEGCQQYKGIVDNLKSHPCGTIAYNGDVVEDIGVIMVKSESTERECFVAVIESGTIDSFGLLKNDYLVVDSIGLMYDIYKEIGIEPMSVNELLNTIEKDSKTWEVYKDGFTMCINQAEQEKSTQKVMRFKPKNIAELTQWIAGIRPAFKSMYKIFENREHFDYGIKAFDNLIQDEYCPSSFILYQEQLMHVLEFAGFEIGETYTIIKAISKKKKYVIDGAKKKFIPNFAQAILDTKETTDAEEAHRLAEQVWEIVENSAAYGFNCVSGSTKLKRSSNGRYHPTVKEMYDIMHDSEYAKETGHKHLHKKYQCFGYGDSYSMFDDSKIRENRIIDITPSGIRQTYKITTESGKYLICTDNHKFPTPLGELPLSELKVGNELYCMGKYEHTKFDSSLTNGDFESNVPKKGQMGFQKKENGASVIFDRTRIEKVNNKCNCEECNCIYSEEGTFELHHKDGNRKNNSVGNLMWVCNSCHKKIHYKMGRTKKYEKGIPTYLEKIISIEPYEVEQVYNIEMADPNHNFVLDNGLITSNSAHAYCMAIDSVTLAWQKANYPLEFYKVCLQRYTNKGNKDKVTLLKKEMLKKGITLNDIKFGDDNRKFSIDHENKSINQTMESIKNMQKVAPDILYELGKKEYPNVNFVFQELLKSDLNKKSIDILIKLDYFREYGDINLILIQLEIYKRVAEIINKFSTCKQLSKTECEELGFNLCDIEKYSSNVTQKLFKEIDNEGLSKFVKGNYQFLMDRISKEYTYVPITTLQKISYQVELMGYSDTIDENIDTNIYILADIEFNGYGTPFFSLYHPNDGEIIYKKVDRSWFGSYPLSKEGKKSDIGSILRCAFKTKPKKIILLDSEGNPVLKENGQKTWVNSGEFEEILTVYKIEK